MNDEARDEAFAKWRARTADKECALCFLDGWDAAMEEKMLALVDPSLLERAEAAEARLKESWALLECFCVSAEAAVWEAENRGSGGQTVGNNYEFGNIGPSTVRALKRWAADFRAVLGEKP